MGRKQDGRVFWLLLDTGQNFVLFASFFTIVSFVYSISYFLYTRMSTITEQLTTILVEKLDEKLAPLNSTIVELRKSLDKAIKHVKFVDAKYDDLLKKMKKGDEDRKALWTENKTLKL